MEKETILTEIISTQSLSDYEATNILWTTLAVVINVAKETVNNVPEQDRQEWQSLIEKFSEDEMKRLLKDQSVDSLVFLDPPLETVLTGPEGTADEVSTMRAVGTLRSSRDSDPKDALINLIRVLKTICTQGLTEGTFPFDKEILSLTRKILYLLCILTVSKLS
jgi:hypothetical protein